MRSASRRFGRANGTIAPVANSTPRAAQPPLVVQGALRRNPDRQGLRAEVALQTDVMRQARRLSARDVPVAGGAADPGGADLICDSRSSDPKRYV